MNRQGCINRHGAEILVHLRALNPDPRDPSPPPQGCINRQGPEILVNLRP